MKTPYQIITIIFIISLGLGIVSCTSLNQGSDELTALVLSKAKVDCSYGVICSSRLEINCFESEYFYSPKDGVVCQRFDP